MSLGCNILNAIGGQPQLDQPRFIPKYPGHLPGCVEHSLIVPLAPLSKQLVHDVFMVIEEPKSTVDRVDPPSDGITIGEFYEHLKSEIHDLNKEQNIFTGDPCRQLVTGFPQLQTLKIVDEQSTNAAIDLIIGQGEGSSVSPLDPEHELAHYYKYSEIYYGRALISNPSPRPGAPPWVFEGRRIRFDQDNIYPVITNPTPETYHDHPRLADLNTTFNQAYSDVLRKLNLVFNGQPDYLGPAMLTMQGLGQQAHLLMSQEIVPGLTAGPTFTFLPA
jgi:hypothetical protein